VVVNVENKKKLIHCYDHVALIFYVVDLSGYNRCLLEDDSVTRLTEDLHFWEVMAVNPLFANLPYILVLNQRDTFQNNILSGIPLSNCFSDYSEPTTDLVLLEFLIPILSSLPKVIIEIIVTYNINEYEHALDFIKNKFRSVISSDRKLWIFVINALVTKDVQEIFEFISTLNVYHAARSGLSAPGGENGLQVF